MAGYLINPLEVGWTYMTDNYSDFTIATWFSIVLHEVRTLLHFIANCACIIRDTGSYLTVFWPEGIKSALFRQPS